MNHLQLTTLGGCQLSLDNKPLRQFRSAKIQALLVYLAVEADRPHRRESLATLLWGDEPNALNNLRLALFRLRQLLMEPEDGHWLEVNRENITFHSDASFRSDAADLLNYVHNGDLKTAAQLYQGDFLAGFVCDSEAFEEWATVTRERFHRMVLETLEQLCDDALTDGQATSALAYAQRQLALESWRESAHRQVMRALAQAGDRSGALAQFDRCADALLAEFGIHPSPETSELYDQINEGQLLRADRNHKPPTSNQADPSIPAQKTIFHRPPARTNSLIGRERELAEITERLSDPQSRLVTLTGPGGIGKTRLALEVANLLCTSPEGGSEESSKESTANRFTHGAVFVSLAALDDPALVVGAIQAALGISTPAGKDAQSYLLDYLEELKLLILLDNYEQLASDPALLIAILERAPAVKLLLTSRLRLNLAEEWVYEVSGLSLPKASNELHLLQPALAEIARSDAVQLFVRHAQQVRSNFVLSVENAADVLRICTLVAGLPLALELAASWVRAVSCAEIRSEIEQNIDFLVATSPLTPTRHRSLEAVFDSSWRHLDAPARMALLDLSVFRGSFDRKASAQVAQTSLTTMVTLIDHSFLRHSDSDNYEMHELLRQLAAQQLAKDPEKELQTQTKHAEYYTALLHERADWMNGAKVARALDEIAQHFENIRAAWQRAIHSGLWQSLERATHALYLFCTIRGRRSEVNSLLESALATLAVAPANGTTTLKMRLQSRLGACYLGEGEHLKARKLLEDALDAAKAAGNLAEFAFCLCQLGFALTATGDTASADRYYEESMKLYERLGDTAGCADLTNKRGVIAHNLGNLTLAKEFYEQARLLAETNNHIYLLSTALFNLGKINEGLGQYQEAVRYYQESLHHPNALNDPESVAYALYGGSVVEMHLGNYERASEMCLEAQHSFRTIGMRRGVIRTFNLMGEIAFTAGHEETARTHLHEGLALAQWLNLPIEVCMYLTLLGHVELALGNDTVAWANGLEAQQIAEKIQFTLAEPAIFSLLGAIKTVRNERQAATDYYQSALTLAQERNSPMEEMEAQLGLATLRFRSGDVEEGAVLLQKVLTQPAITHAMRQKAEKIGQSSRKGAMN